MLVQSLPLKYLFGAHFADDSEYFQGPEDCSVQDTRRSAYFDLCLRKDVCEEGEAPETQLDDRQRSIPRPDITLFQLVEEGGGISCTVDLRDGHFEINGAPFWLEVPPKEVFLGGKLLTLVYFRRRRHHQTQHFRLNNDLTPELESVEETQECEFHMGWRYIMPMHPETDSRLPAPGTEVERTVIFI